MSLEKFIIEGGVHQDERGSIHFVNDFNLDQIKRFYRISHNDILTIRAWQGHKEEQKWFYCIKGSFEIKTAKLNDWKNSNTNLSFHTFNLSESKSQILHIPAGYINGFRASQPDSSLMVFSDKSLNESKNDDYRFDKNRWPVWE